MRRALLTIGCAALLGLSCATPTHGESFPFVPTLATQPSVPPVGYFNGPCGLGVDSAGRLYVSDYYHHTVDLFGVDGNSIDYEGQLTGVDPLDGPCGLALDSSNRLYVDDFDRNVLRYGAFPSFGSPATLAGAGVDGTHPTGVAVDPATGNVYVDERTYVTGYDSAGNQLMDGASPLMIGLGDLGDGYGLAISTSGRFYVADASTDTVKAFVPAISKTVPQLTITGAPSGFTSLRQATLAVDWSLTGNLYVVDDLQPASTEQPVAQVEVFSPTGSYLGVLRNQIVDALPAGLAVDNTSRPSHGSVYVTSGNARQAGIYEFGPNSQVPQASVLPPTVGLTVKSVGGGLGAVRSSLGGLDCESSCSADIRSSAQVKLSAVPERGSSFAGWSGGDCSGMGECTLTMDQARAVSAAFEADSASAPASAQSQAPDPTTHAPATPPHRHRSRHRRQRRTHHHLHRGKKR